MSVRAKFKCESVIDSKQPNNPDLKEVSLIAVYDSNPESENGKFFRWTPSGQIKLSCVNPEANKQFEVGKEYYIDFTKVN